MDKNLHRFSDWEDRLRTYLARVEWDPFVWGTHDCALFVASAVNAMTGVDYGEPFRGTYTDNVGAARALREHGAGTLLRTMTKWLGEPTSLHHAKRGDIVMLDRTTSGVCVGKHGWFIGQPEGLDRLYPVPTRNCLYAFSVPFGPVA